MNTVTTTFVVCSRPYNKIADEEPWRTALGQNSAAGPIVPIVAPNLCPGETEKEQGTDWWRCKSCGFVGQGTFTHHITVKPVVPHMLESAAVFMVRRRQQSAGVLLSLKQMAYVASVAVRQAAELPPDRLNEFVEYIQAMPPVS